MALWTRRTMLRSLAIGSVAASWCLPRGQAQSGPAPLSGAIVRNGSPEALTRRAVEALGGMARFVRSGQSVVIKPNIGWDRTPEQAANTHPGVVATLVRLALEAGAGKVAVMDHTCNDPRRCYQRSGIEDAAADAGASILHLRAGRGVEMEIGGRSMKRWPVFREIVAADVLINAPIVKHHGLSRATLGMKNWFGAIDGRRSQLHQDLAQSCVDLALFFRPALTVLDGTRALLRNGPQGGDLKDVIAPRAVMAGTDPVAIEAFGAGLLDLATEDLPHVALAERAGLGRATLQRPDIGEFDLEG